MYEENKKFYTVSRKLDNFLRVQHPELLRTMQKKSLYDEMASDPDMVPGSSHPTSTRTANTTAQNASGTLLYKTAYINLNDDAILQLSDKDSRKLLLLAFAFKNVDSGK